MKRATFSLFATVFSLAIITVALFGIVAGCDYENVFVENENEGTIGLTPSFINEIAHETGALKFASTVGQNFLNNVAPVEPGWINKSPVIEEDSASAIFSISEDSPSFILFNVTCDGTVECGYVIVNIDGATAPIPQFDAEDHAPIPLPSGTDLSDVRIYWISPLDWFVEGTLKNGTEVFSRTGDYPIDRQQFEIALQNLRLEYFIRTDTAMNVEMENAWIEQADFGNDRSAVASSGQIGGGNVSTSCTSPIPCYIQKTRVVGTKTCYQGCTPAAFGMLYGYWDLVKGKTSLVSGSASTQTTSVNDMIWALNGYLGTVCRDDGQGATTPDWSTLGNANKYPKAKGYAASSLNVDMLSFDTTHFNNCKTDIDSGIPCEVNYQNANAGWGHSVPAYGYTISGSSKYFKVNTGWSSPKTTTLLTGPTTSFDIQSITKKIKVAQ